MNRIITQIDVVGVLKYSKKNLGEYTLMPIATRKYYNITLFFSITILLISICGAILIISIPDYTTLIAVIVFFLVILAIFKTSRILIFKNNIEPLLQKKRLDMLTKYYNIKAYNTFELNCLNKLLEERLKDSKVFYFSILATMGTLLLPIWNAYIMHMAPKIFNNKYTTITLTGVIARIIVSIILVYIFYIMLKILYLILSYRKRRMKNLIYLTNYIIYNKEKDYEGFSQRK